MGLFESLKNLIASILSRDPEVAQKRAEVRKLHQVLAERHPPWYRPRQNHVLPGFAFSVLDFARHMRPLAEIAWRTVASSDARVAQRHFDFLLECRLSPLARERRPAFSYDGMAERLRNSLDGDRELEIVDQDFQAYIRELENIGTRRVNEDLGSVERFIDIARFDWERLLSLFDPSVSVEKPTGRAEFSQVDGEQVLPELLDLYYVLDDFSFDQRLRENIQRLADRRSPTGQGAAKRRKIDRLLSHLDASLKDDLSGWYLLTLARAIKSDPAFLPSTPRERRDHFDFYRRRLTQQYAKDRERLERERHEDAVTADLGALFGGTDIAVIEGYDEEMDSYVRRESPEGFLWVKPLRVLKTYIASVFEPLVKEPIKRLLVEGYFENKAFQNNMANILYRCERSGERLAEFESQLLGNGRISIASVRRYVEELRRGKDIGQFLARLVDAINGKAREIVEDEAGLFIMLGDAVSEITAETHQGESDVVANLRTFGGSRNKELMAQILAGRDRAALLSKIMRNYSITRPPASLRSDDAPPLAEVADPGRAPLVS